MNFDLMQQLTWSPRVRFILSVVLWGIFVLESYRHHDTVRLPPVPFFLGMVAILYLCLYVTENASDRGEEVVGSIGSHLFLVLGAMGSIAYLFGVEHIRLRDIAPKWF